MRCFESLNQVRDEIVVRRRKSKSDSVSDDEAEVRKHNTYQPTTVQLILVREVLGEKGFPVRK